MLSLHQQLENCLKPLRLEAKQGFTNQSVIKGLDRYLMGQCEELLKAGQVDGEFSTYLKALRSSFSQYMTYSPDERRELVEKTQKQITDWIKKIPAPALPPTKRTSAEKQSLLDLVLPFVSKDKVRAFHLTGLKTVEDLLHYPPKWAVNRSSFTPIAQCENRDEPYFILARINGVSQVRRGRLETVKVVLQDASGHLSWVWFNRPYLKKELTNGRWVLLHETPQVSKWGRQVVGKAETFEFLAPEEEQSLRDGKTLVFYPSTATLTQSFWRKLVGTALDKYRDALPQTTMENSPFGENRLGGRHSRNPPAGGLGIL